MRVMSPTSALSLLLLLQAAWRHSSYGFVPRSSQPGRSGIELELPTCSSHPRLEPRIVGHQQPPSTTTIIPSSSPSALCMVAGGVSLTASPLLRRALVAAALGAVLFIFSSAKQYKRIFWPGSLPDPSLTEPLPPGSMGCPFLGINMMAGTHEYGPYVFFDRAKKKLGNPNLFKFYAFGTPMISIKGSSNIKAVLKHEFEPEGVNTIMMSEPFGALFGDENILYEQNKDKHGLLRRLAGAAMTPAAVSQGVPAIQKAAQDQIDHMLRETKSNTVKMEQVCNDFTMDVAWRQILGLNLHPDEVPAFHKAAKDWINGIWSPLLWLPFRVPGLRWTKGFRARKYLVSQVERKLKELDRTGPDGSTLSGIYFAKDDDNDDERKLTHKQVIDNALILIFAGSETTASTLTVLMLLLGLHPKAWQKIKEEQQEMRSKCGEEITKQTLDEQCPYLDAVIRETLRLRPVQTTEIRNVSSSIVVDGKQIPKNWKVLYNIRATHEDDPVTKESNNAHMDVKTGFKPERWLDPSTKPSEWMPFGDGARRCLGERLSITEMKVFLAMLARQVNFELVGPTEEIKWQKMSVMAKPLDGVEVAVRAQQATGQPA